MPTGVSKELRVTSFTADDERGELGYGFIYLEDGVVIRDAVLSKRGENFNAALDRIKVAMCAAAQAQADAGQPIDIDPYELIKAALHQTINEDLKLGIE